MEERQRFVIELLLGLIFIVFLIIIVFLVIGISKPKSTQAPTAITNSYNNNYNLYQQPRTYTIPQQSLRTIQYTNSYTNSRNYNDKRYMDYDDSGRLKKSEGIFGNDLNNYEVYVRNDEFKGGYFEVTFYFEDYYGEISKSSETHYIPAREEKKFFYKDVSPQRYEYRDWWYDVKSLSQVPSKEKDSYDNDMYYVRNHDTDMPMMVYYYR